MRRRDLLVALLPAVAAGCAQRAPRWALQGVAYRPPVSLPTPERDGRVSLERAIATRRSRREFRPDPLPITTIGQLLWAGQGVTSADGKRAAPSAGARYPIELYVVTASEVLHYLPSGHRVEGRAARDLRPQLRDAAFGQEPVAAAPVVLAVAAQIERTRRKYGGFAEAFVEREVGHVAQNVLLSAAALGLAAVPIGSVDGARCARTLLLPPQQLVHYLIPVGIAR